MLRIESFEYFYGVWIKCKQAAQVLDTLALMHPVHKVLHFTQDKSVTNLTVTGRRTKTQETGYPLNLWNHDILSPDNRDIWINTPFALSAKYKLAFNSLWFRFLLFSLLSEAHSRWSQVARVGVQGNGVNQLILLPHLSYCSMQPIFLSIIKHKSPRASDFQHGLRRAWTNWWVTNFTFGPSVLILVDLSV